MKTILVTGGAGYIGSHVNQLLHSKGYHTIVLDNLSTGSKKAVVAGELVVGSIADQDLLKSLFSTHSIDAVIHLAASIDVGESVRNPAKYYENNTANSLILFDEMRKAGIKKAVFSSTAAVYGIPELEMIDETIPPSPINPYGRSKLMVEEILKDFAEAYAFESISLRYFNVAGGDPDKKIKNYKAEEHNLIPAAIRAVRAGASLSIFGTDYPTPDGTGVRDYIHVMDLAEAHILALEALRPGAQVFNLGNERGFSVREVLQTVETITGKKLQIHEQERRKGDPAALIANSQKARNQLGWIPKRQELATIVQDAWNAYPKL